MATQLPPADEAATASVLLLSQLAADAKSKGELLCALTPATKHGSMSICDLACKIAYSASGRMPISVSVEEIGVRPDDSFARCIVA